MIFSIYDAITTYINNQPQVITKLENIEIGQKFEDFMFKNSGFEIDKKENKIEDEIYYSRKAENQQNYASVTIKNSTVLRILLQCKDSYDSISVNGIECHSFGESIIEKFGQLVNIQCLKDKENENYLKYRVYDVAKYGVRYHLISNQITLVSNIKIMGEGFNSTIIKVKDGDANDYNIFYSLSKDNGFAIRLAGRRTFVFGTQSTVPFPHKNNIRRMYRSSDLKMEAEHTTIKATSQ